MSPNNASENKRLNNVSLITSRRSGYVTPGPLAGAHNLGKVTSLRPRAGDLGFLHFTPPPIGWRDRLLFAGVIALCVLVWGFIGWRLIVVLS